MLSLSSGVAKASKISLLRPSPLKCDTNRFEIIPTHDHSRIRVPGWRRARSGRRSSGRRTSTRTLTPARTSRPARCPSRCTWRPGPACWCVVQTSNSGHQPRPPPADRRPMFAVWTAKVRTRWRFAALDELADDFEGARRQPARPVQLEGSRRREFCHSAAPPSTFSRCINSDGEGMSVK